MKDTRELVKGAMFSALVGVIQLLNVFSGGLFLLAIPLPLMYYGMQASSRNLVVASVVSMILVFILSGFGYAVMTLGYAVFVITYCWLRKMEVSKRTVFVWTAVVNLLNYAVMIIFFSGIFDVNFTAEMETIGSFFGISSGRTLVIVTSFALILLSVVETWCIIMVSEMIETMVSKIEK